MPPCCGLQLLQPKQASTFNKDDPEYLALAQDVNAFLLRTGRGRGFAPGTYYVKVAFLLLAALAMEALTVSTASVAAACGLGLTFALIGLNIQHDANHGAVSAKPWVNLLLYVPLAPGGGNRAPEPA